MLSSLRDSVKYLKWFLLVPVIFAFAVFFGPGDCTDWVSSRSRARTDWVARVDGRDIDMRTWMTTAQQIEERYRQQLGEMYEQLRKQVDVRRISAEQLVQRQLILADARRLGLTVTDGELAAFITSLPQLQQNGVFVGRDQYVTAIRRGMFPPYRSEMDFERALREELLIQHWQNAIGAAVVVTGSEIEAEFRRRNERATFEYVALPYDRFGAELNPADAELEAWYKAHQGEFGKGEGRRVLYVLFDDKAAEARVQVTDEELRRYYDENRAQFTSPEQRQARHVLIKAGPEAPAPAIEAARRKAQDIAEQARGGADFAALASQFSEDEGSRGQGGDLGLFPRGRMVAEFDEAVFTSDPGAIVGPVRTNFGFHVIKVERVQAAGEQPFDAVKEQIRGQLRFPRLREAALEMAREFKGKVATEADLRRVAGELKVEVKDAGVILQGEPVPGLGPVPPLTDAAFATDKGKVSDVVPIARGAVVLVVQDIVPDYVPPLATRRERVLAAFRADKGREEAKQKLAAAVERAGGDLAKAAKALSLEVKSTVPAYTRSTFLPAVGTSAELDQAAFAAPLGSVSRPVATDEAALVIKVSARTAADMSNLAREESAIREALRQPRAQALVEEKLEALREGATIEYNEEVLRPESA